MELTSHIGENPEPKEHQPVAKAQKHNNAKVEQVVDQDSKILDNKNKDE